METGICTAFAERVAFQLPFQQLEVLAAVGAGVRTQFLAAGAVTVMRGEHNSLPVATCVVHIEVLRDGACTKLLQVDGCERCAAVGAACKAQFPAVIGIFRRTEDVHAAAVDSQQVVVLPIELLLRGADEPGLLPCVAQVGAAPVVHTVEAVGVLAVLLPQQVDGLAAGLHLHGEETGGVRRDVGHAVSEVLPAAPLGG